MALRINSSPHLICKWKSDTAPHFETRIGYNEDKTKIVASLINTSIGAVVDSKTLSLLAVFEHCVWKANDLPAQASLESRLFRTYTSKKASWVGVDLPNQRLHITPYTHFENDRLKTYAPVFNHEKQQVEFRQLPIPREEACDPQAEKGMVRPSKDGEEEIVHIWDHVGENGANDLRLIHQTGGAEQQRTQEALILRLFYRASGMSGPITLTNQSPLLIGRDLPISERIVRFIQHPVALLEGRCGNAYTRATLSTSAEIPVQYQEFLQGRSLQAVSTQEIAQYLRDQVFVVRDSKGQVQGTMKYCQRVTVERHQAYDFGPEHGKLSAIQIHISESNITKWKSLGFRAIAAFLAGLFNCEAPKIYQLEGLNMVAMEDLLLERSNLSALETDPQRIAIFNEFDRAISLGADVDYYIAENRKTAKFCVGSLAFAFSSSCAALGRLVTFRDLWDEPKEEAPLASSTKTFSPVSEEKKE